jgi:glycosyltransferase involved in cell wall biosynthesis
MEAAADTPLQSTLRSIAVLIPAWQPDERLIDLARCLAPYNFAAIIVVNDGSGDEYERIFERVRLAPSVVVIRHEQNRGQGCAVKTALRFALGSLPDLTGAVTADADGQHAVNDIIRVAEALATGGGQLVLGTRSFDDQVPLRSRFGNILTQYIFAALSASRISDTQTGLRGVPRKLMPEVLDIRGDRFEFAISLLAHFCNRGCPPLQVPVATIYLDRNRSSHFRPVRDSIRIYLRLIRCYVSLFAPICVDFLGFFLASAISTSIALAVLVGRIGAVVALLLQHRLGYGPRRPSVGLRVASLAFGGLVAFTGIWVLTRQMGWHLAAAKILVESVLWLVLLLVRALTLAAPPAKDL